MICSLFKWPVYLVIQVMAWILKFCGIQAISHTTDDLNNRPIYDWTGLDHSNTELVCYSDSHCNLELVGSTPSLVKFPGSIYSSFMSYLLRYIFINDGANGLLFIFMATTKICRTVIHFVVIFLTLNVFYSFGYTLINE